MVKIHEAEYVGGHQIRLRFDTGEEGIVDLSDLIARYSAAQPLADEKLFAEFTLDEWPTLVWPCGFDLSPEVLYERVTGRRPAWQRETVHESLPKYRP
jgi:hypothetical protein